jgi:signal transduction histidine kinase
VPLAATATAGATELQFEDRLADTVRFAALAQRPVVDADPASLQPEMRRYDEVYGVGVALVDRAGRVLVASRAGLDPHADERLGDRVSVALAGRRSEPPRMRLPWQSAPMPLAEPVLVDGEVRAAVLTVSPTTTLCRHVLLVWAGLFGAGLLALALAALVALPLVRWIMRPVQRLDSGLARVAAGVLSGEPAEPVADGRGPSELRRLSTSFDQMAATVTQALATQRAFVADASHQLRNPLTALRLRLHNLDGQVSPAAAEEHEAALEEADRLGEVLDGLLALARAERAPAAAEEVALDEAVEDRLDAWRVLAEAGGLELCHTGRSGLRVRVPPGTVPTVLDAVLDNAIKFSPPGGEISVHTVRDGDGRVLLAVRDHGPGLTAEELERATDRFWRSPAQSNVEGSGLGLAIARTTAGRAGGELGLERPEGGGLRVCVRLPAAPGPPDGAVPDPPGERSGERFTHD